MTGSSDPLGDPTDRPWTPPPARSRLFTPSPFAVFGAGTGIGALVTCLYLTGQLSILDTEPHRPGAQARQIQSEVEAVTALDRLDMAVATASTFVEGYSNGEPHEAPEIDLSRLLEREIEAVRRLDDLSPDRQARARRAITEAEDLIMDIEFR